MIERIASILDNTPFVRTLPEFDLRIHQLHNDKVGEVVGSFNAPDLAKAIAWVRRTIMPLCPSDWTVEITTIEIECGEDIVVTHWSSE